MTEGPEGVSEPFTAGALTGFPRASPPHRCAGRAWYSDDYAAFPDLFMACHFP